MLRNKLVLKLERVVSLRILVVIDSKILLKME